MDYVHASVRTTVIAFVFLLVCFAVGQARAATIDYGSARWISYNGGSSCQSGFSCTAEQACRALSSSWYAGYSLVRIDQVSPVTLTQFKAQGMCVIGNASGSTTNFSQIVSDTAYASGPPPPTCPSKGTSVAGDRYTVVQDTQMGYGLSVCIPVSGTSGGCSLAATSRTGTRNTQTGKWEYIFWGPLTSNGTVCSGNGTGASDPVKDPPVKCSQGMCTGTVNGVEICVKCATSDSANTGTKTTTNPDGSTTQTTTNTSTTINNNNVTSTTTTTTVTTPAGGGTPTTTTKTDTTNESLDSYCQRVPTDSTCKLKDGQVTGGDDCVAPPVCSGDAVQCAILKQAWLDRCQYEKANTLSELGAQVVGGDDPVESPAAPDKRDVRSLEGAIDKTAFLGSGGLQDKVFTVNGRGITFPFSRLNQYLSMIGNIFVAISLIGAARIVVGVK